MNLVHMYIVCQFKKDFSSLCSQAAEAAVMALSVGPGEVKTETVEEFISIADGQVGHCGAGTAAAAAASHLVPSVLTQPSSIDDCFALSGCAVLCRTRLSLSQEYVLTPVSHL